MNKIQFSDEVIKVLDAIAEKIGVAIDWTSDNVMPIVTELLGRYRSYSILSDSIWLVVCIAAIISMFLICKQIISDKNIKKQTIWVDKYGEYSLLSVLVLTFGGMIAIGGIIGLICVSDELLRWIIIPEFKYIELLKGLM